MLNMIRWLGHMLLWSFVVSAASAGGNAALRVYDAARLAPADIDVLASVHNAAGVRRGALGPAASAMLQFTLGEGETARAWTALAQELGWSREEAFDRLLGSNVAFAARGVPEDGDGGFASWALLSEVSLDTEKRLRERLRVAPRAIVAGHTVLSVERGAYELTAERRAKHATIILAPSDRNALFDELIPLLAKGPASPLSATPEFAELRALGGGEAMLFVRSPAQDGAWAGFVARREEDRVVARVVAAPRQGDEQACEVRVWDASSARRTGEDALFWTVERSLPAAFGSSGLSTALSGLPIMRLRERAADLLGDYLGLWVAPSAEPGSLPEIAAALEVQDMSRAPAQADALMAELLASVGLEGVNFAGVEPSAVRSVDLHASRVIRESGLWKRGPEARWGFVESGELAPARSWWVMGLGGGAFDLAASTLRAPARPASREVGGWVAIGGARPAAALEALRGAGLNPTGPVLAASLVEDVRWSIELAPGVDEASSRLRGDIEARLTAPAGARVGPR